MSPFGTAELRERLGRSLGRLRASAGLSQPQIAKQLGWSQPKVSRVEAGKQRVALPDVEQWCRVTGASDQQREEVLSLAERALLGPTSWDEAMVPASLQRITAEVEARAGLIRVFQPAIFPGLLQTAAYARRVFSAGPDGPPPDLAERVLARLERQRILYDEAKRLQFVVPEAVLRWPFGPPAEHDEQLARLGEVILRPNADLRILPMTAAPVWRTSGFVLFGDLPDDEPFVHIELLTRPVSIDEPQQVEMYRQAFVHLQNASAAGKKAEDLITRSRRDMRELSTSANSTPSADIDQRPN